MVDLLSVKLQLMRVESQVLCITTDRFVAIKCSYLASEQVEISKHSTSYFFTLLLVVLKMIGDGAKQFGGDGVRCYLRSRRLV